MRDIVLGAFQSCDAEVVGRAERIRRAVGVRLAGRAEGRKMIGRSERVDGGHLWTYIGGAKRV